jgi:hypothetical protein
LPPYIEGPRIGGPVKEIRYFPYAGWFSGTGYSESSTEVFSYLNPEILHLIDNRHFIKDGVTYHLTPHPRIREVVDEMIRRLRSAPRNRVCPRCFGQVLRQYPGTIVHVE